MSEAFDPQQDPQVASAAKRVLRLASWFVPEASRSWLEAMAFELAYIPESQQLGWAWGMLGFAVRERAQHVKLLTPTGITLATTLTAVLALIIVLPQWQRSSPGVPVVVEERLDSGVVDDQDRSSDVTLSESPAVIPPGSAPAAPLPAEPLVQAEADRQSANPEESTVLGATDLPSLTSTTTAGNALEDVNQQSEVEQLASGVTAEQGDAALSASLEMAGTLAEDQSAREQSTEPVQSFSAISGDADEARALQENNTTVGFDDEQLSAENQLSAEPTVSFLDANDRLETGTEITSDPAPVFPSVPATDSMSLTDPLSTATPPASPQQTQAVAIFVIEPNLLEITRLDGETVFARIVQRGERLSFTKPFVLKTNNASGLNIEGKILGTLGEELEQVFE